MNQVFTNIALWNGHAINAAPVLDLGVSSIRYEPVVPTTFNDNNTVVFGQQFTVTEPQVGNIVGVELNAGIRILAPTKVEIVPIMYRITAAAGAAMGNITGATFPQQIAPGVVNQSAATEFMTAHYTTQAIILAAPVAGTYVHGFGVINNSGAAMTVSFMSMHASVRQLNDQQNQEYRDTRR